MSLEFQPAEVKVEAAGANGQRETRPASFIVLASDSRNKLLSTFGTSAAFVLPAGAYSLEIKGRGFGDSKDFQITPGQSLELEVPSVESVG